ncbi:MAG TPA: hypothetical protein PKW20_01160, partial [Syntrophales bacterium]|nr:hypothetical protein [Syntrophales bacterium]
MRRNFETGDSGRSRKTGGAVRRIGPVLFALCLFLSAPGKAAAPPAPICPDGYHGVTRVLDGSSFEITGGVPVRLIGVAVSEGGDDEIRARETLSGLIGDGPV